MSTKRRRVMGIGLSILLTAVLALSGCGGAFRLYDASRAKRATDIKDQYTKADVVGTIEVEKKNLDNLLAEELKVVRDNEQLRVDYALLRIADDNTPMANTYTEKAEARLMELGVGDFKAARADRLETIDLAIGDRQLQEAAATIKALTKASPPPCRADSALRDSLSLDPSVAAADRTDAQSI